jgi:hypothetical protein
MGRDETILYPVRKKRLRGPAYTNVIRFGDGRYFRTALYKEDKKPPLLRFLETKLTRREVKAGKREVFDEKTPRASAFLTGIPVGGNGGDPPHYRGAFYFEGRNYDVRLWVRSYKEKKVLYLRLDSRPVGD